jgi:hypothetical protein
MRIAGMLAVACVSWVSLQARADNARAWNAAKAGLPAETKVVVSIDVAAIQKSQLFTTFYPKLLEKAEYAKAMDAMKSACKIDALAAVQGVVFASDNNDDGALYVALSGIDRTKLSSCFQALIPKVMDKPLKVTVKQDGNITEATDGSGEAPRYFGWVGKDVLVVPFHAETKAAVNKWMGGKGALAKSVVGKKIAKVNTSAAVWGAGEAAKEVQPGVNMTGAYGTVAYAKGNFDVNVRAVIENAAQASTMTTAAQKQLDEAKGTALAPPAITSVLKTITVTQDKDEVVIKSNVPEADLMSAVNLALAMMGP